VNLSLLLDEYGKRPKGAIEKPVPREQEGKFCFSLNMNP